MTKVNFRNQKDLTTNQQSCIVHSALGTKTLHSAFSILNSCKVLFLLAVAIMVSGNVWGGAKTYYATINVASGGNGTVYVGEGKQGTTSANGSTTDPDQQVSFDIFAVNNAGYHFTNWASTSGTCSFDNANSASTKGYVYATSTKSSSRTNGTVTAYFTANTYYVQFNGNGFTGGEMANQTFTYGTAQNLSANTYKREYTVTFSPGDGGTVVGDATVKATYNFNSWNTNSGGTGTTYNDKASVNNLTTTQGATVDLYAQWNSQSVTLPNATKANHSLEGWYNGSTRVGGYGDKYTPTANVTLTAKWALSKLTVTLNPGEGSVSPTSTEVTYGGQYGTLPTPTDDDKLFEGWFTSASGGTQVYSTTTVTATTNHTLYAHWATVQTTVLGYVTNKDTHVGGKIYISSGKVTDISNVPSWDVTDYGGPNNGKSHKYYFFAKADTGYDFTKWTDSDGGQVSTSTTFTPTITVNTISEGRPNPKTVEYYAIFTVHKWTLGWAGFTSGEATTSYTAAGTKDYGSAITAPTLRRYGWKHNGWSPTFQETMPDNDVTYTAQWLGVTVTGATAQTKNFTAQTQTQTATLTFPVTNATDKNDFNAPTLSGDAGWTISSWDYSNNNVTVTLSFTATENSTTSGNHVTTVTLKAKNDASATGTVTASVNMTPSITSTIASSYFVEDASINLSTAWTSTSNGTKHYQLVSFTPAEGEQSGSTAPTLTNNILTLGKAGSVVIKFWQDAGTSSRAVAETTKTITINRITNTLTADATHTMEVGDTWNNVYSKKNSDAPITTTTSAETWAYFNPSNNTITAQNTSAAGDDSKSVTIKIEQAETYKYTNVSKSIAVTVNKKTPIVNWTSQTYYINNSYSNVFSYTGDASLFSSSSSDGAVAEMTGLTSMQTFNKSAETTITVTATENYMWKGDTFTKKITPNLGDAHVTFAYTQSLFDNTSITHASNAEWPSGKAYVRIGGQKDLSQEEGTVAIKFSGIPDKMLFNYSTSSTISGLGSSPKWRIYESTDGSNWGTEIWSDSKKSSSWVNDDINYNVSLQLKPETRYLKLYYYGYCAGDYRFSVSELQYFKTDISSISYDPVTIGSTAPIKSFKVQHCNAGYQTSVVAPAHFQVSLNQSDWSDEVVISTNATAVTGGDKMGEPTVYVKYLADAVGSHNGSIQVKNNLLADQTVTVSGSTVKMVPPINWLIADQIANGEEIAKSDIATTESSLAIDFTSSNTDVAYFEDGMLIAQAAGTTTITATITGNDFYADRVETKGITVTNKTIQTITWNQNFDLKPYGSAREKLTATASSGLAVEYSTDDSNVASITKEGNDYYVNFVNVGQTNIYANQAGDGTYAAASTKTKFVMVYDASQPCPSEYNLHTEKTDIKDDYEEYDVKIPQSFYCETHANSLASQNFYVKQYVNNDWQTIYDEFISSGDYQPVTLTAANGLSENATKIRYGTNASRGYKVQNVKYTQKTSTSVDKSSLTFSAFPSSPTVPQTIKVTNYNRMILVTTNDANFVVSPAQLGACGSKTETDLSIYYNAPATEGTYPAKLYLKDNTGDTKQTIDLSATVAKLSQTVAFSGLSSAYNTTDKVTLAATSNKAAEKDRNFTYSVVSTNGVASITGTTLTFLKSGSATIRVTEAGDNMYNSAYADATIEVSKVTPTITTVPTAAAINYGNPLSASTLSGGKATTTLHGATGTEVFGTWAWHEPTAVKTANGGIAQAYQVDFTPTDGGMYNATNCQVSVQINQIAQTINWDQTIGDQVYNGSLTLTASNGTAGGGDISYSWTPDLATISGSTLTFSKGVGTITVTARAASNANFTEATKSKSFNILRINPTITKKDINDTYLVDADQIDLQSLWTTNGDGVITYSKVSFSPSSTINGTATEPFISDNRYLSFGQAGTLVIRLSMAQGSYYNAITDEKTITINKRTPDIEFVNNTYYFNSTYPNVYTVNDGDATLCTLTSSDQDVAVVEGTGIKTYNKLASTKLTLTSAENYKWAKKTIETTITPTADPNVPAFRYTKQFYEFPTITTTKSGNPYWDMNGHNKDKDGKLTLICASCESYRTLVGFNFKGSPTKISYEYSNTGTTLGTFAVYGGVSSETTLIVKHNPEDNEWYSNAVEISSDINYLQWTYANNPAGGDFSDMKVYGNAYIMATNESSLAYGVKVKNDVETKQISLAHANIGYSSTISSDNAQFVVSVDGTSFASSQTISTKDSKVTGGGIQGIKTLYIKYLASAEGVHNAIITIADEDSHSVTISVSGETQGKLNTKATWTGESSYPIGVIENAFVATDDNDNIVAGSWTLTSKDESIFQIQGENIAAVCGGTATIDGIFTPNASATYKNCTTSVSLTAVRNANTISWARYEDGKNDIHFLADDQKWISDVAEAKTAIKYTPGTSWTEGVIIFNADSTSFRPGKVGTVDLRANAESACKWSSATSTHAIIIDYNDQTIFWDQALNEFVTNEQGQIDQWVDLTAVALDKYLSPTGVDIQYTIDAGGESVATVSGTRLHLTGVGTTYITAATVASDKYQPESTRREIKVRRWGESCSSNVLYKPLELTFYTGKKEQYEISGPVNVISFNYKRNTYVASGGTILTVNLLDKDKTNIGQLFQKDYSSMSTDNDLFTKDISSYTTAKYVEFNCTSGNYESNEIYINDLVISQKSYFKANVNSISKEGKINVPYADTITVEYSDVPKVEYAITDHSQSGILFAPIETPNNDCGKWGSYKFTLSGVWKKETTIKDTITFWTSAGQIIKIPLNIQINPGITYTFKSENGNWSDLSKWRIGTETPTILPGASNPVDIYKEVTVDIQAECYSIYLRTNDNTGEYGTVVIDTAGGLTVGLGGANAFNSTEKFRIKSSTNNQGYFRMDPEAEDPFSTALCPMPMATMEYATKGTLSSGANKDATWQYFGIPVATEQIDVDYITWFYHWSEQNGWDKGGNNIGLTSVQAWNGYCVTQYGQPVYEWKGRLLNCDTTINLTINGAMQGDNMVANSYSSPVDVKNFTTEDFSVEKIDGTFYIFNSGSWKQWKQETDSGQHLKGDAPGAFTAIPILSAKDLDQSKDQTMIAPMQGICIHAKESGAWVRFDYAKHVWAATNDPIGKMVDPLRAPSRTTIASPDTLQSRVRLQVYAPNSGVDHLYLLQREKFTMGYDNGYDAPKMLTNGLLNIYTHEDEANMAVSARNKIDSTYIGMIAGEDNVYQLTITSVIGDSMLLKDMSNGVEIPVVSGQTYTFNMDALAQDNQRFLLHKIAEPKEKPDTPTQLGEEASEAYIWVDANYVHIENATANSLVGLFASDGKLVVNETINRRADISINHLVTGMYLVYVDGKPFKFVKK